MKMKDRYRNILEKVYEVEGLLLLAMSKEETPEGLDDLIERRISELMAEEESKEELNEELKEGTRETEHEETEQEETIPEEPTFYALEDEEDNPHSYKRKKHERQSRHESRPREGRTRKAPAFSLNDRYLFIREIFGGDATAFNAALERVARASDFSEAQAFLAGECGLRPDESETDARFIGAIEATFK